MGIYGTAGLAGASYASGPVRPVDKVKQVNGALQTKTVKAKGAGKSGEVTESPVVGNGDYAVQNQTGSAGQAQSMYYDNMTRQRVWYA